MWQGLSLALACAVGLALCLAPPPAWWLGAGILCGAAAWSWPWIREGAARAPSWAPDLCVALGLLALTAYMLGPVALGDRPVDHDHPVHYFRVWETWAHFLPEGRLLGWSSRWFAGQPANYLYPMGADLWVIGVWLASFGLLSLSQAYAVSLWLFYALLGYAVYRLGRTVGGRAVGLLAALWMLVDGGAFRAGGWVFTMEWGVWPQTLSVAFATLAVAELPAVMQGDRWRPVARFGACLGFAILCHPLQLVFALVVVGGAALVQALRGEPWVGGLYRLALGAGLALALAALWLLPFFSAKDFAASYGAPWRSAAELGAGLYDGKLFRGTHWFPLAFGIVGGLSLLRSERWAGRFTAVMIVVLLGVGASTFIDELHLPHWLSAARKLQYERFGILLKPFGFVAAGAALVTAARGLGASTPRAPAALLALLVGVLIAPIAAGGLQSFSKQALDRSLTTHSTRPLAGARAAIIEWARAQPSSDGVARWAVFAGDADHRLMDLAAELDAPMLKLGFMPASTFRFKPQARSEAGLRALNVRYTLSSVALKHPWLELREQRGGLWVYENKGWTPEPFEVVEGAGELRLLAFSDERIEFEALPGAQGRLRLNVSHFDRWRATRDGEALTISRRGEKTVRGAGFMRVDLSPGHYVFEFRRHAIDHLGVALSALALLLCPLLFFADGRRLDALLSRGAALSARLDARWPRAGLWCVGVALALAGIVGLVLGGTDWPTKGARSVDYDVLERLHEAEVSLSDVPCHRSGDGFECDKGPAIAPRPTTLEPYSMRRCIAAVPRKGKTLRIDFPEGTLGRRLRGHFGARHRSRLKKSVTFTVEVDGKRALRRTLKASGRTHRFDLPLPEGASALSFTIRAKGKAQDFCFFAQSGD